MPRRRRVFLRVQLDFIAADAFVLHQHISAVIGTFNLMLLRGPGATPQGTRCWPALILWAASDSTLLHPKRCQAHLAGRRPHWPRGKQA